MSYARPALADLVTRISNDLGSRVLGGGSVLRRSVLGVIAYVMAAAVYMLYGFIDYIYQQCFPDTAESANLARWANLWGIVPAAATSAAGLVSFTGSVNGTDIPIGTVLSRADGALFTTTTDVQIAAGVASPGLQAQTPGAAGNTNAGVALTLQSPIAGVNSAAVAGAGGLTGGADQESDASLLQRFETRLREPPQGGASTDYVQWVQDALPGVATRVWTMPAYNGLGTVGVTFVEDNNLAGILPGVGDVATAQTYINGVRPVTAQVTVFACVGDVLALTLHVVAGAGYSVGTVQANVQASANDMISRDCGPGGSTQGTLLLKEIVDSIVTAAGVGDYALSVVNGGAPANVVTAQGHLITSVVITWV